MKIYGINSARAICTIYIVGFWHILDYNNNLSGFRSFTTYHLTITALATFCLISGYLLAEKNQNTLFSSTIKPLAFYKSRLLKIYPLYILALISFLIVGLYGLGTTVRGLFLISLYTKPTLPTLWFMAMIFFFYLLLPWMQIIGKSPTRFFVCTLLIWLLLYAYNILSNTLDQRVLVYLPSFAAGVYIKRYLTLTADKKSPIFPSALILLIPAIYYSHLLGADFERDLSSAPYALVSATVAFYIFTKYFSKAEEKYRIISFISDISFVAYLFHRPIYDILRRIYIPIFPSHELFSLMIFFLPILLISSLLIKNSYAFLDQKLRESIFKNQKA